MMVEPTCGSQGWVWRELFTPFSSTGCFEDDCPLSNCVTQELEPFRQAHSLNTLFATFLSIFVCSRRDCPVSFTGIWHEPAATVDIGALRCWDADNTQLQRFSFWFSLFSFFAFLSLLLTICMLVYTQPLATTQAFLLLFTFIFI